MMAGIAINGSDFDSQDIVAKQLTAESPLRSDPGLYGIPDANTINGLVARVYH
jgi:hypothetical protein